MYTYVYILYVCYLTKIIVSTTCSWIPPCNREAHERQASHSICSPKTRSERSAKSTIYFICSYCKNTFWWNRGGGTARPPPAISPKTASERSEKNAIHLIAPSCENTVLWNHGGGRSHAQGLSPPMISQKSVFARENYKINVGAVNGAPLWVSLRGCL